MKITWYKKLSGNPEIIDIETGKTLAEQFPDVNWEYCAILINSKVKDENTVINEGDIVMIRQSPAGGVAAIITIVVIAVVAVAVGVVGGIMAYKARKAAEKNKEELEKLKKEQNTDADNRPFLRGASNTLLIGKNHPYVCGRCLFAPYLVQNSFYQMYGTDGANTYTYMLLDAGFNYQVIHSISTDDIIIKTFDDTTPQQGVYDIDPGIFAQDGKIEIRQDGTPFEILTLLNGKHVSTACDDEVVKDSVVEAGDGEYLTYTLDANAKDVEIAITFPYGLHAYDLNNVLIPTQLDVTPLYSLDGGNTWIEFYFNQAGTLSNHFRRVAIKEILFTAQKTFTLTDYQTLQTNGQKQILIRVRSNGNTDSSYIKNECYVKYYQSNCYDPDKSSAPAGILDDGGTAGLVEALPIESRENDYCCLIGLRLKATKLNEGKLKKVNIVTSGTARVWDGEEWSEDKVATRNPAAWALEILTSPAHPASRYSDSEIDFDLFAAAYEACETAGYKFDYVITNSQRKADTINFIMDGIGGALYQSPLTGLWGIALDAPQEQAKALYNSNNFIDISHKKIFGRRSDGLRIKYINSANDLYLEDTYLVMRCVNGVPVPYTAESIIKDVTVTGITTHEHIVKYARRLMAIEELRPKTTPIEIGNEGIFYRPYDKILIQDDSLKIGLGKGIIKTCVYNGDLLAEIITDSLFTFESGKFYGIIVTCYDDTGVATRAIKVSGTGTTQRMTILTPVLISDDMKPEAGNNFSFGELDENGQFSKITSPFMISTISRGEKGFKLEVVDYNEAIYETGPIPAYKSNITQKPPISQAEIPPDYVTGTQLKELLDQLQSGNVPMGLPSTPLNVAGTAGRDGITLSAQHIGAGLENDLAGTEYIITRSDDTEIVVNTTGLTGTYTFNRAVDGYPEYDELAQWTVKARFKNVYGKTSEYTEPVAITVSGYGTWQVAAPVITKRESNRAITLYFEQPARSDNRIRYGTIRHRVQVKRISEPADSEFYKPATAADPRASESNYKDGTGYVIAAESFSQTMPLIGQNLEEPIPQDTTYQYSVIAYNEASVSATASVINAVAHATSIEDIVENAIGSAQIKQDAVTADKIYVRMLSAIQENLGYITGGIFEGTENNRWALSTVTLEDGSTRYEGAMRVGGDDEYFEVIPYNIVNGVPQNYHVKFKAGDFEISAQASNINGVLYVIEKESALDRTAITPQGTFYQHRDSPAGDWYNIGYSHTNGFMSSQFFSEKSVIFTNQTMAQRRLAGHDIGAAMPSAEALVYHFDTDYLNQHQTNGLTIEDAPDGTHMLVGAADTSADIDFTPAILTIAPYATVGKSLYGQCAVTGNFGNSAGEYSIDFWEQYIYAENQVLFDVGTPNERVRLVTATRECFLFGIFEDENVAMFTEMTMTRLFYQLGYSESIPMFEAASGECAMFEAASGEVDMFFTILADEPYNANYEYYEMTTDGESEIYTLIALTEAEYYEQLVLGLYVKTCEMNTPRGAYRELQHIVSGVVDEAITFEELGLSFEPNTWVHFGIFADSSKVRLCINSIYHDFDRAEAAGTLTINMNQNKTSVIIDELLIDPTTAASYTDFVERTQKRIPFGTLAESENWFILTAANPSKIKTNLFDAPQFVEAVEAVLRAHNLIGD